MTTCLPSSQINLEKPGLEPHEIRAELVRNRVKINVLAGELGCSTAAIHQIITGDRRNPKIRAAISQKIHIPEADIWPDSKPQEEVAA